MIRVRTPIKFNNTVWYIDSYIRSSELTGDYWKIAIMVLWAAVIILSLAGYYSRFFLRGIVKPVEDMSAGLRQVEEGNLDIHIQASGQYEVRTMIHLFNSMVRRLKVLITEYEEKVRNVEKEPQDYFTDMLNHKISPEEVSERSKEFFMEHYAIIGLYMEGSALTEPEKQEKVRQSFEHNSRFSSRCLIHLENPNLFILFYRITEEHYLDKVIKMIEELQNSAYKEFGVQISACIGQECFGHTFFEKQVEEIQKKISFRYLYGSQAIICLQKKNDFIEEIMFYSNKYEKLATALYVCDEKNLADEKEALFDEFSKQERELIHLHVYAVIMAIAYRFTNDNGSFSDIFGQQYNYVEKVERIEDIRNLKLWLTNLFTWIIDYSATKLNVSETDMIVKAKRYLADNYDDSSLTLTKVAEYVDLNEKYFTNRFSKETGETFSNYLTGLRIQKAKQLLKTTTFKVYEIAEMVGYNNTEHFNRMFKKLTEMSPAQYRKTM